MESVSAPAATAVMNFFIGFVPFSHRGLSAARPSFSLASRRRQPFASGTVPARRSGRALASTIDPTSDHDRRRAERAERGEVGGFFGPFRLAAIANRQVARRLEVHDTGEPGGAIRLLRDTATSWGRDATEPLSGRKGYCAQIMPDTPAFRVTWRRSDDAREATGIKRGYVRNDRFRPGKRGLTPRELVSILSGRHGTLFRIAVRNAGLEDPVSQPRRSKPDRSKSSGRPGARKKPDRSQEFGTPGGQGERVSRSGRPVPLGARNSAYDRHSVRRHAQTRSGRRWTDEPRRL